MLKDAESSRSSTQDGEDQKLELVRNISALICKVAKRRAERWTFDEAAHELDKQRRWNSEGYDWWLTWLESRSKAGEITLLDGDAQADEINAALRADRNWRSEFAPRLPSAKQASERRAGRWDYVMDANPWWLADSIAPINAAMLLSRRNPNVETVEDAETSSSDEMEPKDFRRLKNIFEGAHKEPRTLKAWTAYARQRRLKIHSWINKWEAWVQEVDARQALVDASTLTPPFFQVAMAKTKGASGGGEPEFDLPWWQTKHNIFDMAQNIGARLKSQSKRTSNTAIAKEIEKRINDIERSKATGKQSPNYDTIRGVLTGWKWKPD